MTADNVQSGSVIFWVTSWSTPCINSKHFKEEPDVMVKRMPPKRHRCWRRGRLWRPLICTTIHLCSRPKPVSVRGAWWWYVTKLPGERFNRNWKDRLVPPSTTHYIREHRIYIHVGECRVCKGIWNSPVKWIWIYECVPTFCDVRMAYPGEYIQIFGDDFWCFVALVVVYILHYIDISSCYTYITTPPPPVCVLFTVKPFFLLVDIQHTQCPRSFFILERHKLRGYTIRYRQVCCPR